MKKRILVGLLLVLVAIIVLSTGGAIRAQPVRTEFTSLEYDCFTGFEEGGGVFALDKNVMHVRGILHDNVNISDTPEMNGIHHTVADAEFNSQSGVGTVRGTSELVPEGIDGAWVGHWVFLYNNHHSYGWAVWRGTGELSGKMAFVDVYDEFGVEPPAGICDDIGGDPDLDGELEGIVRTAGYILNIGAE
jgi:hypothetical protein